MTSEIVEVGKLLGVVRDALLGAVVVSILFSLAVVGFVRAGERQAHRNATTFGYAALSVICLACCGALVVFGVTLLTRK